MINFPISPVLDQTFIVGGVTWIWDGAKWTQFGATSPGLVQGINSSRIINGDMRIDQRNNGAGGTAAGYTIDRWAIGGNLAPGHGTWGRNIGSFASAPGFPYYLGFSVSTPITPAATDSLVFQQPIEADMVSDFAWGSASAQSVTLSFWAYSNLTGTFGGAIRNTAATRSYPFTFSLPTAGTWTRAVITILGDTAGIWAMSGNAASVYVAFDLGSGNNFRGPAGAWSPTQYLGVTGSVSLVTTLNAYLMVTGVKLEIGTVATPFNRQSLAKTMADCQRYYEVGQFNSSGSAGNASNGVSYFQPFLVLKRGLPTITPSGTSIVNVSGQVLTPQPYGFLVYAVTVASGGYAWLGGYTASAEL